MHTLPEDGQEFQTFRCSECSCVFKKLGSLNAHISREHAEQTVCSILNFVWLLQVKKLKTKLLNSKGNYKRKVPYQMSKSKGQTL